MLWALMVTLILAILFCLWTLSLPPEPSVVASFAGKRLLSTQLENRGDLSGGVVADTGIPLAMNPYAGRHAGFLGFANLRPRQRSHQVSPFAATLSSPGPFASDGPSLLLGGLKSIETAHIAGQAVGPSSEQSGFFVDTTVDGPTRPVSLIQAVHPRVPPIAQWNKKEGYVEVLLLVDRTGIPRRFSCRANPPDDPPGPVFEIETRATGRQPAQLQFYVAPRDNSFLYVRLTEEPREYHFADYLLEVLPHWKFAPAIRDGQPVEQFVVVQYWYCDKDDPNCREIIVEHP
jgi:hypothetical protein